MTATGVQYSSESSWKSCRTRRLSLIQPQPEIGISLSCWLFKKAFGMYRIKCKLRPLMTTNQAEVLIKQNKPFQNRLPASKAASKTY
jgi:hypothetical protein